LSVDAENNYIEIGLSNINQTPSKVKFVSFHKELNDNFYLLGQHRESKNPPSFIGFLYIDGVTEKLSSLGIGYIHSLKNYDLYAELSAYRYAIDSHFWHDFGLHYSNSSELLVRLGFLKAYGGIYRLGLRKNLNSDIDIDINYGYYRDNSTHSKTSSANIKLVKSLDDSLSLAFGYEQDTNENWGFFSQAATKTRLSLSLRNKF
jgi:hypothetical protein